ncbi:MAG: primase-helicase family protein [Candidatus Neomarinimicrobiota bacterium]
MKTKERIVSDTIELSLATKNFDGNKSVWFQSQEVKIKDLERILKKNNYSTIKWNDGYRKESNFLYAVGFTTDIDSDLQIHDAETRLKELDLNYIIIPSKKHTPESHRFHILLPFNRRVWSVNTYKKIAEYIATEIFEESDDSVTDAARFIYGSPDSASISSNIDRQDYDVDEFGPLWDKTLKAKINDDEEVSVLDIKEKTVIHCPFHSDDNPSAFIDYSKPSENWFISCSACNKTFWMDKSPTQYEKLCRPYWSYGTDVFELGMLGDEFFIEKIGKTKFHILTGTTGPDEEKKRAFEYLVQRKHISHITRIDYLADIDAGESFHVVKLNEGVIEVHFSPLLENIQGNDFVENYLEDRFGQYKTFIKEYLAVFCYSNYKMLPTLILKGPRGNGKSTFAEVVGEIFQPLTFEWQGHEEDFTYEVEKKLLIVEENESSKMSQYKTLKKYSGQKYAQVKKKFKDPYKVRNNMNIILLTNESIPLYVSKAELPIDERNNQFFVHEFPTITKALDTEIQDKLTDRLGYYVRTELRSVYQGLNRIGCRYSIEVPITAAEELLFTDNVTDIEADADKYIQKLVLYYNSDSKNEAYPEFIDAGYLPTQFFRDFDMSSTHYNRVIKNLKKRKYLVGDIQRLQFGKDRHYCYEITDKLDKEIKESVFEDIKGN